MPVFILTETPLSGSLFFISYLPLSVAFWAIALIDIISKKSESIQRTNIGLKVPQRTSAEVMCVLSHY